MYLLLKMVVFHCYVSLPEGRIWSLFWENLQECGRVAGSLKRIAVGAGLCCLFHYTRWWFQIFVYVHPYLGKMIPIWRSYFSDGLVQPPTSFRLVIIWPDGREGFRKLFYCICLCLYDVIPPQENWKYICIYIISIIDIYIYMYVYI